MLTYCSKTVNLFLNIFDKMRKGRGALEVIEAERLQYHMLWVKFSEQKMGFLF